MKKTNVFKNIYNWFLNVDIYSKEQTNGNNAISLAFLFKSLGVFVSLFLSFVFPVFKFLPALVLGILILTENSYNRLNYFAFFAPFWLVIEGIDFVFGIMCVLWALKILQDVLNKKVVITKKLAFLIVGIVAYGIIVLKFSIANYLFLLGSVCLFLFMFLYRDKLNYKAMVMSAVIGIIYSAILGFVGMLLKNVYTISTAFYYPDNNFRFNGCIYDPNFFSLFCVCVFASLTFLFLNNNLKFNNYCLFTLIFVVLNILTGSKMGFFIMVFILLFLFGVLLFKKDKEKWKQIGILALIIVLSMIVVHKNLSFMFSRMAIDTEFAQINGSDFALKHPYLNAILTSKFGEALSSLTTYRFTLWIFYLGHLLENPINLFFGFGTNQMMIEVSVGEQVLKQPHNSIIDMVMMFGIVFVLLVALVLTLFILFKHKKRNKFNVLSILPIVCITLASCAISLFWSGMFLFLVILFILPMYEKRGDINESVTSE